MMREVRPKILGHTSDSTIPPIEKGLASG